MAAALINQGNVALEGRLDPVTARARYESALTIMSANASEALTAVIYGNLAEAAYELHEPASVEKYALAALALLATTGDLARSAWARNSIARARLARNDVAGARAELALALEQLEAQPNPGYLALCVETVARLLNVERSYRAAATLVHAARRLRKERRVPPIGHALVEASSLMSRLEESLGRAEHEGALRDAAEIEPRHLAAAARRMLAATRRG
jgi:hypothetical protein